MVIKRYSFPPVLQAAEGFKVRKIGVFAVLVFAAMVFYSGVSYRQKIN
jgi:hypothetical protein